jgi:elongation factor Tu
VSGDPNFHLVVEDVFLIRGRGTVVTGRVEAGSLKPGDEIVLRTKNGDKRTVVTGIESFRKIKDAAHAGDNVGVLLRDITKEEVQRGDELIGPGADFTWAP